MPPHTKVSSHWCVPSDWYLQTKLSWTNNYPNLTPTLTLTLNLRTRWCVLRVRIGAGHDGLTPLATSLVWAESVALPWGDGCVRAVSMHDVRLCTRYWLCEILPSNVLGCKPWSAQHNVWLRVSRMIPVEEWTNFFMKQRKRFKCIWIMARLPVSGQLFMSFSTEWVPCWYV